jgi:hypothetical protein
LAKRNPRWDLEEEDDAAEKVYSERIRVFSWQAGVPYL